MLAGAYVMHDGRARLRVRIPAHRREPNYFAALGEALGKCPGVRDVQSSALTGSVLVLHETTTAAIGEYAESEGLFRLFGNAGGRPSPIARMAEAFREIDGALREWSDGSMDLPTLGFVILVGLAVYQMQQGALFASASTLLWYATSLLLLTLPAAGAREQAL